MMQSTGDDTRVALSHSIAVAQYDGDREPDGNPDRVVTVEAQTDASGAPLGEPVVAVEERKGTNDGTR